MLDSVGYTQHPNFDRGINQIYRLKPFYSAWSLMFHSRARGLSLVERWPLNLLFGCLLANQRSRDGPSRTARMIKTTF